MGWWLAERQLPNGGLNGRPEKLEDVCYSWWVLSSLSIIDRIHWINKEKLINFILSCQVIIKKIIYIKLFNPKLLVLIFEYLIKNSNINNQ